MFQNIVFRVCLEFIEEVFPLLEIKDPKKKKGKELIPLD